MTGSPIVWKWNKYYLCPRLYTKTITDPDSQRKKNRVQNLIHIIIESPGIYWDRRPWNSLDVIMQHLGSDGKSQDYKQTERFLRVHKGVLHQRRSVSLVEIEEHQVRRPTQVSKSQLECTTLSPLDFKIWTPKIHWLVAAPSREKQLARVKIKSIETFWQDKQTGPRHPSRDLRLPSCNDYLKMYIAVQNIKNDEKTNTPRNFHFVLHEWLSADYGCKIESLPRRYVNVSSPLHDLVV